MSSRQPAKGFSGNCLFLPYCDDYTDDWVITGPVNVEEGTELTFRALHNDIWYFSMENLDWETGEDHHDRFQIYRHRRTVCLP